MAAAAATVISGRLRFGDNLDLSAMLKQCANLVPEVAARTKMLAVSIRSPALEYSLPFSDSLARHPQSRRR